MKQYPWNFKIRRDGIEWYQTDATVGTDYYFHYLKIDTLGVSGRQAMRSYKGDSWFRKIFGWQTFGLHKFWHDGPHAQLNLYFIVIYWSTKWTSMPKDY